MIFSALNSGHAERSNSLTRNKPRGMSLGTLVLILCVGSMPSAAVPADSSEADGKAMSLTFAFDGRPASLSAGGDEYINRRNPGRGFVLHGYDYRAGKPIAMRFKSVKYDGRRLIASLGDFTRIEFDVKATPRYLALRMTRVEGVPKSNLLWLSFELNSQGPVRAIPLDYMTQVGTGCDIRWPWLWARSEHVPLGGFAIYAPQDEADEDETLLHIWANEDLPHPRIEGEWTVDTARTWLSIWQKRFSDQSQLNISAKTPEELYRLADFASELGMRQFYMHTDTWRGEYWPKEHGFLHLHPEIFPRGEQDLQAFADYTASRGVGLVIHTVSAAIANADPDYIVGGIDPRLATWIEGTLEQDVSARETTLRFRPGPGFEMPLGVTRTVTGPAHKFPWSDIQTLRIGNELIHVGEFLDTDRDVWRLVDCRRGFFNTSAADHSTGAGVLGLYRPYNQCFTADSDSTLVEELGRRMAEFYNRNNIIHCEHDAAEIHTVNHKWGYDKFSEAVYTNLDHPVTSNNSGGRWMSCQFEYRFNSSKPVLDARRRLNGKVLLTIARNGRPATGPYELDALTGKAVAQGARGITLAKPEPFFGITTEILEEHGLSSLVAELVVAWREVAQKASPETRQSMLEADDHVIFRAQQSASGVEVTPRRMLARPGIDIGWSAGSEFGAVVPRQYIKLGDTLGVVNPWQPQTPEFVIRVMNGFNEQSYSLVTAGPSREDMSSEDQALLDDYNVGAGLESAAQNKKKSSEAAPRASQSPKHDIQPQAGQIERPGDHRFFDAADGLRVRFENPRNEEIRNDNDLPYWSCHADMSQARGIGLTVTGDGSGAILVIQAHMAGPRDYIVPLDFTGERDIVIPCGEAAWADARWGWRFQTKGTRYGPLRQISMGLGLVPPRTAVDIRVSKLRVLSEIPTSLVNPTIELGDGSLSIQGSIPSESYLWYGGGSTVGVYDLNWNKQADLPVEKHDFVAPRGPLDIRIHGEAGSAVPWLECQFFVKGNAISVE